MVKAKHDKVTLTIDELREIFIAGNHFGFEHALVNIDEMNTEDMKSKNFEQFMNIHHAIELI